MSREHEEMLARVRVSDRMWSESDLYYRTNRWAIGGSSLHLPTGGFEIITSGENVGRSTYRRNSR
jgi:hypothetical protein